MYTQIALFFLGVTLAHQVRSQSEGSHYRSFPIIVSLQFHNLAMPFKDVKSNFTNVGFGLGTELSYNKKGTVVQQFMVSWHHNRTVGNGIMLFSQGVWRPNITFGIFGEVKAGAGYMKAFRPVESFRQNGNGAWESVGHKGKGMLVIPFGISFGYQSPSTKTYFSPFISYQFMLLSGYNQSIPLVPQTLIQVGSRIHLSKLEN
ncbi:MAG: hypothetical protein L6Q51_02420 [Cyclobacteriaceae bacterium]|nr:hypothetical protein [Cyclobacteriaceae bacterium]